MTERNAANPPDQADKTGELTDEQLENVTGGVRVIIKPFPPSPAPPSPPGGPVPIPYPNGETKD